MQKCAYRFFGFFKLCISLRTCASYRGNSWDGNKVVRYLGKEWSADKKATLFARSLLANQPISLSSGVMKIEVTNLLIPDRNDEETLFVRKCQRSLWEFVLESGLSTNTAKNWLVIGNPGIGKTFSVNYFIKLLLERGQHVVLHSRKDNLMWAFVHLEDGLHCYVSLSIHPHQVPVLQELTSLTHTWYLLDPVPTTPPVHVRANTVIAASPFMESVKEFIKRKHTKVAIMPLWDRSEVEAIRNHIHVQLEEGSKARVLSANEMEARYWAIGGVVRALFSPNELARVRVQSMWEQAIQITLDDLDRFMVGSLDTSNPASPSQYLFGMGVSRHYEPDCGWNLRSHGTIAPISSGAIALLSGMVHDIERRLASKESLLRWFYGARTGVRFERDMLNALSCGTAKKLTFSLIQEASGNRGVNYGRKFTVSWKPRPMRTYQSFKDFEAALTAAVSSNDCTVLHVPPKTYPVIDAAFVDKGKLVAIQFTVSLGRHPFKRWGWNQILRNVVEAAKGNVPKPEVWLIVPSPVWHTMKNGKLPPFSHEEGKQHNQELAAALVGSATFESYSVNLVTINSKVPDLETIKDLVTCDGMTKLLPPSLG
eukprot:Rmarinus@m.15034